jgi:pimeloyl-ACP methyl ester carboxylesterase
MLHGWACNRRFWRRQFALLEGSNRVLALDFRGHGESSVPDSGFTLDRLAEDVHVLLHGLQLAPAVVIGHSMGGMVAQQLAITHPGDVRGLILVATAAADPEQHFISAQIANASRRAGFRAAFLESFPRWFLPASNSEIVSWVRSEMLATPERVALGLVKDYRHLDLRSRLPAINAPCLVIGASGDVSTPVTGSEVIARLIPGSELKIIEGAGHFVQLERPDEIDDAIRGFLRANGL